jgi:hypothetical protein
LGDYTSLNSALAGEQGDLVASDVLLRIDCYNMIDTAAVSSSGFNWNYDVNRYVTIRVVGDHGGIFGGAGGTSVYSLQVTGGQAMSLNPFDAFILEGISVSTDTSNAALIGSGGGPGNLGFHVKRSIFTSSDGTAAVVYVYNAVTGLEQDWESCIIYGAASEGFFFNGPSYLFNITISGPGQGCHSLDATVNCYNVITDTGTGYVAATTGFAPGIFNNTNCAAKDNTFGASTGAAGTVTNCRASQSSFTFVNAGSHDYHLSGSDTAAKGFGVNVNRRATTALPAPMTALASDVDNQSIGTPWNIGADQPAGSQAGTFPKRPAMGLWGVT